MAGANLLARRRRFGKRNRHGPAAIRVFGFRPERGLGESDPEQTKKLKLLNEKIGAPVAEWSGEPSGVGALLRPPRLLAVGITLAREG